MSTADVAPVANALMTALTTDAPFTIPTLNFSSAEFAFPADALNHNVVPLTPTDITNGAVDGPGIFDLLMRGFKAHLTVEFEAGRITGSDYTKAYIALTESAMSQGIAFMLGKDTSFWQALNLKTQAFNSRVALEQAKVQAVATQFAASAQKAEYALAKLKMASEGSAYTTSEFNLANILPKQDALLGLQNTEQSVKNDTASYNLSQLLPKQALMLTEQIAQTTEQTVGVKADSSIKQYTLSNMLPEQLAMVSAQKEGQLKQNDTLAFTLTEIMPQQKLNLVSENALTDARKADQLVQTASTSYTLTNMLPEQLAMLSLQNIEQGIKNNISTYTLTNMLPEQLAMLVLQKTGQTTENASAAYNLANLLPAQLLAAQTKNTGDVIANESALYNQVSMLPAQLQLILQQRLMVNEQTEAQRAQTADNRSDGALVTGVLGKQKELYAQQITSYQRDAEMKVAKIFSDSWITQKTIDEGLTPPNSFTNPEIEKVLVQVRAKNNIGV